MRTASLLVALCLAGVAHAAPPLTVSTLPFDDEASQKAVFNVLSQELSRQLKRPVRFVASQTYTEVIEGLSSGKIDVGFVGAVAYVKARRHGQVRAVLRTIRNRQSSYRGALLVPAASTLSTVKDLKGKKVAFVDENSTTGYVYPREMFQKAGLSVTGDLRPVMLGSHQNVVEAVAKGQVDAGAAFEGAENSLDEPARVRVLAYTEAVPGDPVVVRAGLGVKLVNRLRTALITLATNPKARSFFTLASIDSFMPSVDRDYDGVAAKLQ